MKTHLMFAVREELDVLRGKITELEAHVRVFVRLSKQMLDIVESMIFLRLAARAKESYQCVRWRCLYEGSKTLLV